MLRRGRGGLGLGKGGGGDKQRGGRVVKKQEGCVGK